MKVYIAVALAALILLSSLYEIGKEADAIRNIKIEINGARIKSVGIHYITMEINVSIINNGSRNINKMEGLFQIFILNISFGKATLDESNIGAHSKYSTKIPLRIYYLNLTEGIVNAIKEGNFELKLKGKITGRVFFGLLKYSQSIEARWP